MAAATWTTTTGIGGVKYHTATMNSTDGTAILPIDPRSKVSYTIKYDTGSAGSGDSLTVAVSTAVPVAAAANMVNLTTSVTADYHDTLEGPITAMFFDSSATDTHVIRVIEITPHWSE